MLVNKEYLAIPKEFDKLIISLRTAYANEYSLDKEQTSYSDSLDALRLSCKMYPIKDLNLTVTKQLWISNCRFFICSFVTR